MAATTNNGRLARDSEQSKRSPIKQLWHGLRALLGFKNGDTQLRESIEEIIGEIQESDPADEGQTAIGDDERIMLTNILRLRHLTAYDVMVPRADIVAVDFGVSGDELSDLMSTAGHSRVPVYSGTLDEVVGLVHIKDVMNYVRRGETLNIADILRRVLFVAPSMAVIELLLEMRVSRVHMALVVDEFGGIDGLITIEDLVEEIVGEIEDEHDTDDGPKLSHRQAGTLLADGRAEIEELEAIYGPILSDEEREEDIDTLGGLLSALTGRVPSRGELIEHKVSGIAFEVLEADPRRVKRLRLRNLPPRQDGQSVQA